MLKLLQHFALLFASVPALLLTSVCIFHYLKVALGFSLLDCLAWFCLESRATRNR